MKIGKAICPKCKSKIELKKLSELLVTGKSSCSSCHTTIHRERDGWGTGIILVISAITGIMYSPLDKNNGLISLLALGLFVVTTLWILLNPKVH